MRILLTNDDGIHARGILTLVNALNPVAELFVAAPDRERSAAGHSITVFEPIRVIPTRIPGCTAAWTVGGTPVDCVKLALNKLMPDPPDLVISGINHGPNLGTDVLYSGTVSAAAEGILLNIPSMAVSLNSHHEDADFDFAARFSRLLIRTLVKHGLETRTLINVNIPALSPDFIKGIRITRLGVRNYENLFEARLDPRGNTYYWMGGGVVEEAQEADSDVMAVQDGYISITPVHLDLTDYDLIKQYRNAFAPYLNQSGVKL